MHQVPLVIIRKGDLDSKINDMDEQDWQTSLWEGQKPEKRILEDNPQRYLQPVV